jgi:uncharacterized membrane protein YqjE
MTQDIFQLLRSAARALLAQGALHAELFSLEWAEEKSRLLRMAVALLTGAMFLFCSLLSISATMLILSWGTQYQNAVLFGLVAFFVLGTVVAFMRLRSLASRAHKAFSGTLAEVGEDLTLIREKLGD